jgi:hypothetical protein
MHCLLNGGSARIRRAVCYFNASPAKYAAKRPARPETQGAGSASSPHK